MKKKPKEERGYWFDAVIEGTCRVMVMAKSKAEAKRKAAAEDFYDTYGDEEQLVIDLESCERDAKT